MNNHSLIRPIDSRGYYYLDWPGKEESGLLAETPADKIFVPCRKESVDFDTTENLFIEGDNLDALKLLQEDYSGKIKMIYIDPPYNTYGDHLGYVDKRRSGSWPTMIYPRLNLAKNLLSHDGVIFISIDDREHHNLRKICDEVLGSQNFVAVFVWQKKRGGGNNARFCAVEHEYVIVYAKDIGSLQRLFGPFAAEYSRRYKEKDETGFYFWDTFKRRAGRHYYPITCPDGEILNIDETGSPISWLKCKKSFENGIRKGDIRFESRKDSWVVRFKQRKPKGKKPRSLILDRGTTSDGRDDLTALFVRNIFCNPKPLSLLQYLLQVVTKENNVILDFFAGSATTAHAVMQLNAKDGGNRKFIMVQLPEPCNEKSEAFKAGYENIAEISKERIRRAGKKILEGECHEGWSKDIGFKVLKLERKN